MSEHHAQHHFDTPGPIELDVEIGKGSVTIEALDTTETHIGVGGRDAEEVEVTQQGRRIQVRGPRQRLGFRSDHRLTVEVRVPLESEVAVKTGSADINVTGNVGATDVRTGSGDVRLGDLTGPASVETGSGDVAVGVANAELRVKSGSGDTTVGHAEAAVVVSTGSGDVEIGSSAGPVAVKTGSGDLRVASARGDVSLATGSGDLVVRAAHRGRFTAKGASGDVRIGVPAGVPVWTDLSTISGAIHSGLHGAGTPEEGADHVELRARTVSGDIILDQL